MSDHLEEQRAEAFHDLDDLERAAKKLRAERDQLKAENEKLRKAAERVLEESKLKLIPHEWTSYRDSLEELFQMLKKDMV